MMKSVEQLLLTLARMTSLVSHATSALLATVWPA